MYYEINKEIQSRYSQHHHGYCMMVKAQVEASIRHDASQLIDVPTNRKTYKNCYVWHNQAMTRS